MSILYPTRTDQIRTMVHRDDPALQWESDAAREAAPKLLHVETVQFRPGAAPSDCTRFDLRGMGPFAAGTLFRLASQQGDDGVDAGIAEAYTQFILEHGLAQVIDGDRAYDTRAAIDEILYRTPSALRYQLAETILEFTHCGGGPERRPFRSSRDSSARCDHESAGPPDLLGMPAAS